MKTINWDYVTQQRCYTRMQAYYAFGQYMNASNLTLLCKFICDPYLFNYIYAFDIIDGEIKAIDCIKKYDEIEDVLIENGFHSMNETMLINSWYDEHIKEMDMHPECMVLNVLGTTKIFDFKNNFEPFVYKRYNLDF